MLLLLILINYFFECSYTVKFTFPLNIPRKKQQLAAVVTRSFLDFTDF